MSADVESSISADPDGTQSRAVGGTFYPSKRVVKLIALVATPLLVAFVALAVVKARTVRAGQFPSARLTVIANGARVPAVSLPRLGGGKAVQLESDAHRPTVINFFATWCPDCRAELGAFGDVSRRDRLRVNFVGVDSNDADPTLARQLLGRAGATYPVGIDVHGTVSSRDFAVSELPVTYFVGSNGRVMGEAFGSLTSVELQRWITVVTSKRSPSE